jgi:Holliday junction resolvase RusA-like endonuclease
MNGPATTERLIALVGSYLTEDAARADGYRPAATELEVGTVALVVSYGRLRRGIVVKVGRTRASVAFTTDRAIDMAELMNSGGWERHFYPQVTVKSDLFANIWVKAPTTPEQPRTLQDSGTVDLVMDACCEAYPNCHEPVPFAQLSHTVSDTVIPAPVQMHTAESHKLSVATDQHPGTPDDVPSDLAIDTATNALIRDPFSVSDLPPILPMDLVTVDREDRWHDVIQIDEYAERGMVRPIDSQDDREDRWIDFVRLHKIDPVDCVELLSDPPPVPGDPQVLLSCWVDGTPRPKGSLKPTGRQGQRVRLVEQSTDSSAWRDTIAWTVRRELNLPAPGYPTQLPVELACTFAFERAESCTDEEPTGAGIGDTDKLIRNVMDALQDARVYANDRQVVAVKASKVWTADGQKPGALIAVKEAL